MKGRKFADDEDVIWTANGWLEDQDKQFFYNGIQALEKRWIKCISAERGYVKSDKIWCAYLMVNYIRQQTFWTPLVTNLMQTF